MSMSLCAIVGEVPPFKIVEIGVRNEHGVFVPAGFVVVGPDGTIVGGPADTTDEAFMLAKILVGRLARQQPPEDLEEQLDGPTPAPGSNNP